MNNVFFDSPDNQGGQGSDQHSDMNRRTFMKKAGIGAVAATAGAGVALEPLRHLEEGPDLKNFFQDHYRRLTPEALAETLTRIEDTIAADYGAKVHVADYKPIDGVEFGYALNLSRCNGSRRCVDACVKENNHSRNPEMAYIKVLEMPAVTFEEEGDTFAIKTGSFNVEDGNQHYDHDEVPAEGKFYLPVQCHQCSDPPCTKVCPVEATWQEADGITVIDYDWCIGCRYCMAACPYEARRFNFSKPVISKEEINPDMSYLSNRVRPQGVVEKCHFCLHRTRQGKNPACMEACPTGARVFGNLRDPESELRKILATKRVYILKEEAGTIPRFFYYFDV